MRDIFKVSSRFCEADSYNSTQPYNHLYIYERVYTVGLGVRKGGR